MKTLITLFLFFFSFTFFSQNANIELVSRLNYNTLHQTHLNDIWGHVDAQGNEYALVGAVKGTSIVSLQNPTNPIEVFWEPGMESVWRDLKTWQNYAYVTTEAQNGLLIIDMNSLPNASGITRNYYFGPNGSNWFSAHNLYIDSSGYAYIFGANRGNGGVIILDIHTDPMNPIEVGIFDDWYVHDGYVVEDKLFLAHINEGFLSVVNIEDRSNPILLGTKNTHSNFTHNIWTTADGIYGFTTDEVSGAFLGAYDLSDPMNIVELDLVQSSPGAGVIPHNVHVKGDFLITSYYSDGVTIHDVSRPHNMIQVGNYDTYPLQTTSYDGCWGAYPFLPSGLILATDITEGLFVLNPAYQHASFLEGTIYDANSNLGITGVKIEIINSSHIELSKNNGKYATGTNLVGDFEVTYSKVGYHPQTISVNLQSNEVLIQDIYLEPMIQFSYKVVVKDASTNTPILDAHIEINSTLTSDFSKTNGLGISTFQLFYYDIYELIVGKWGYKTTCQDIFIDENSSEITVNLTPGYYDDFTFDYSWTAISNNATSGLWERGVPFGTSSNSAPSFDAQFDCGDKAFVTGNASNLSNDFDDVDGGEVVLISPLFDLTNYETPYIHYSRWFYNFHGPSEPDDTLKIFLSNGFSTVLVDFQAKDEALFFKWVDKAIKVRDFIVPTNNMRIIARVSDLDPNVNITEAGFDFFFVENQSFLTINENELKEVMIYPNPSNDFIKIESSNKINAVEIIDLNGKIIKTEEVISVNPIIKIDFLEKGIYYFKIFESEKTTIKKFIKN
jgi:choice-of-anchor B domain-containing protein